MMQSNPNGCFILNILFHLNITVKALQMLHVIYKTAYFPCIMHSKVLPKTKVLLSKYIL